MSNTPSSCPSCGVAVKADEPCLVCLFDKALEADDADYTEDAQSGFGDFSRPTAGVFGKYILRQKLGEGGMGVIWEVEDTTLGRSVALKMIRGFAFSSDSEKQRFQTEANAVAQLDHSNIVPIYEVGEIDDQPYFSMKLLSGGTLSQRMQSGTMDARDAAAIMEKLARAIQHAHERGVLHRDIKPDNVLFDGNGEPYLTDFGLAKLQDSTSGLTLTHAQIGTPQYMSPEQARGRASDITAASDVWGTGALFYHMLTGRVPFAGSSSGEIFDRIANEEPATMQSPATPVDKDLETLCQRCLERNPAQRPSAEELADELGRWLQGEPIHSRRSAGIQRSPWRVVASAVIFSVIVATIYLWPFGQGNPSAPAPSLTVQQPLKIGDSIALRNVLNKEYLDACGYLRDTPLGEQFLTSSLHVFTSSSLNRRHHPTGTWKIESAAPKPEGSPLRYGDVILLKNESSNGGWLFSCGLVEELTIYEDFADSQQALVTTAQKRQDAYRTGQWLVLDQHGQASGEPVEFQDQILLKNTAGEGGGYLNAAANKASSIPAFGNPLFDEVSSLVFLGNAGEPQEEDFWRIVAIPEGEVPEFYDRPEARDEWAAALPPVTEGTFRFRALLSPHQITPDYIGFVANHPKADPSGISAARMGVPTLPENPGGPHRVTAEISLVYIDKESGIVAFKVENYPPPLGLDISGMAAYLLSATNGQMWIEFRKDGTDLRSQFMIGPPFKAPRTVATFTSDFTPEDSIGGPEVIATGTVLRVSIPGGGDSLTVGSGDKITWGESSPHTTDALNSPSGEENHVFKITREDGSLAEISFSSEDPRWNVRLREDFPTGRVNDDLDEGRQNSLKAGDRFELRYRDGTLTWEVSRSGISFRSLYRENESLRYENDYLKVNPATERYEDFNREATWILEPVR